MAKLSKNKYKNKNKNKSKNKYKNENPPLQPLPLRVKNYTNMDHLFSFHTLAVSVNYYVL